MKHKTLKKIVLATALICLALCGVLWFADQKPSLTAAAETSEGEKLSFTLQPEFSKPSLWQMAWRVGTTQVSTVTIGLQVQPSGSNVVNPRLTYYIKAVCGSNNRRFLSGSQVGVTLGSTFSNSTGSQSIDSHLTALGVSTSQDQTVTYYVYAKLEAQGVISGQTLTAELSEQPIITITYDYGGLTTRQYDFTPTADTYVSQLSPDSIYGSNPELQVGYYFDEMFWDYFAYRGLMGFSVTESGTVTAATLSFHVASLTNGGTIVVHKVTSSWSESNTCWGNQPNYESSPCASNYVGGATRHYFNVLSAVPSTAPFTVGFMLETADFSLFTIVSREGASVDKPKLTVQLQQVDWGLSFAWANQPLSLIAVPVARLLVAAVLALFGLTLLWTASKVKRKKTLVLVAAVCVLMAAFAVSFAKAYAAAPMPVPDKWRAGDLAIYLQSFPFSTYEYVNGTPVEQPAIIYGDLTLNLAVFNATADTPVIINVDGSDVDTLNSEGFYMLDYSLVAGTHSIAVYSPLKVFEQTTFYVKPKPVTPLMPLSEFLAKLEQQRTEIITRSLMAAVAAIPLGVWTKRKTLKHTAWAYPLPAALMAVGYWFMPDYYILLFFGAAYAIAYAVTPDFTKQTLVLVAARNKVKQLSHLIIKKLDLDSQGFAVLGFSPLFWRKGFIKRATVKVENPAVRAIELDGELKQGYIAEDVQVQGETIIIKGDPATDLLLTYGKEGVTALAQECAETKEKLFLTETAQPALTVHYLAKLSSKTKTAFEKLTSIDAFLRSVEKQQSESQSASPSQPDQTTQKGEGENAASETQ